MMSFLFENIAILGKISNFSKILRLLCKYMYLLNQRLITTHVSSNYKPLVKPVSNLNSGYSYNRTSMARTLKLVYHGCIELILESLGTNPIAADLG